MTDTRDNLKKKTVKTSFNSHQKSGPTGWILGFLTCVLVCVCLCLFIKPPKKYQTDIYSQTISRRICWKTEDQMMYDCNEHNLLINYPQFCVFETKCLVKEFLESRGFNPSMKDLFMGESSHLVTLPNTCWKEWSWNYLCVTKSNLKLTLIYKSGALHQRKKTAMRIEFHLATFWDICHRHFCLIIICDAQVIHKLNILNQQCVFIEMISVLPWIHTDLTGKSYSLFYIEPL